MSKHRDPLIATAYHEAGHAVAYWIFGKRFRSISIRSNGKEAGRVRRYRREITLHTHGDVVMECIVNLAGYYAEKKVKRWINPFAGSQRDFDAAYNALAQITPPKDMMRDFSRVQVMARKLWTRKGKDTQSWPLVVALAEELLKVRTMKGTEAREFLNSTLKLISAVGEHKQETV